MTGNKGGGGGSGDNARDALANPPEGDPTGAEVSGTVLSACWHFVAAVPHP